MHPYDERHPILPFAAEPKESARYLTGFPLGMMHAPIMLGQGGVEFMKESRVRQYSGICRAIVTFWAAAATFRRAWFTKTSNLGGQCLSKNKYATGQLSHRVARAFPEWQNVGWGHWLFLTVWGSEGPCNVQNPSLEQESVAASYVAWTAWQVCC